jgi:hypothetical protein
MLLGTENWGLVALGGIVALIANIFYMLGGTTNFSKVLRRYIGTFLLALITNITAIILSVWSWQFILIYPCLIGAFSLPYGADTTGEKILKRVIFALGTNISILCGIWALGFPMMGWIVLSLGVFIGLSSVVLGVWNPFNSATAEQFLISQILTLFIPFIPFIKK